jgi:Reverse transcriptase (RNA-dependent DNA polymerase)
MVHASERAVGGNIAQCLSYHKEVAIVIYVDEVVMIGKHDRQLDEIITELHTEFKVTDEGPLSGFLGININKNGSQLMLTQPTLINKGLTANRFLDCNLNHKPGTTVLGSHKDQPKHDRPGIMHQWSACLCI